MTSNYILYFTNGILHKKNQTLIMSSDSFINIYKNKNFYKKILLMIFLNIFKNNRNIISFVELVLNDGKKFKLHINNINFNESLIININISQDYNFIPINISKGHINFYSNYEIENDLIDGSISLNNTSNIFNKTTYVIEKDINSTNELKTELRTKLKTELKTELRTELKTELRTELKTELRTELKTELKSELKSELETELKNELIIQLKSEINNELESKFNQKSININYNNFNEIEKKILSIEEQIKIINTNKEKCNNNIFNKINDDINDISSQLKDILYIISEFQLLLKKNSEKICEIENNL